MGILKILSYGDEKLRQKAKNVSKFSKKIRILIDDMFDTMYANQGVGLAATQVGEPLRIFVIDVSPYQGKKCPMAFVNPKIIKKTGAMNSYEGCLSFKGVNTFVRRYASVFIKAQDENGRFFTVQSEPNSLLSKALQHEYDHLDGILFVDHARNIDETNAELEKFEFMHVEDEKVVEENELEEIISKLPPSEEELEVYGNGQ